MNKLKLMAIVGVMSAALLLNGCGAQKDAPKENTKQTVDDIIKAGETRQRVIAAFEMLFTKSEDRPSKKHGTV